MEIDQTNKTTLSLKDNFLYWLAGFSDGESSFGIFVNKYKNNQGLKQNLIFRYRIRLHIDDVDVLYKIQNKLKIGIVNLDIKKFECVYVVTKFEDIKNVIIPIFKYTKLYTTKAKDFMDFCLAFEIKEKYGSSLTIEQFNYILEIKNRMNRKRKNQTIQSIDDFNSKLISEAKSPKLNPFWILGFWEAEGSFFLSQDYNPYLSIGQKGHSDNVPLFKGIEKFFNKLPNKFGITKESPTPHFSYSLNNKTGVVIISISHIDSLHDYILPFFQDFSEYFLSRKLIDLKLWSSIVKVKKLGLHLLPEGKNLADKISLIMNQKRYSNAPNSLQNISNTLDKEINSVLSIKPIFDLNTGFTHFKLVNLYKAKNKTKDLIYVYNIDGSQVEGSPFKNKSQTAKALLIDKKAVARYLNKNKPFKNKFFFTFIPK